MSLRGDFISFAHQLEREQDNAFQLWTHLPSFRDATEKFGDYACERQPSMEEILYEAALYIGAGLDENAVDEQVREEWFRVPEEIELI